MKALIVLGTHFYKDNAGFYYSDRIIDYNYLKRYLEVFEKITICGRVALLPKNDGNCKLLKVNGENVEFIDIPDFTGPKGLIKNYFNIRKIIKKNFDKFECVLMRIPELLPLSLFNIFYKKKIIGVELVLSADKLIEKKGIIGKLLKNFAKKMTKTICKKANGVAYVTEKVLQKEYPSYSILHGEDKKHFSTNYSSLDLHEDDYRKQNWSIYDEPKTFRIVHTGYMDTMRKGQDILIRAVDQVIKKGYNVELYLIGDGCLKEKFFSLTKELNIDKKVIFTGLITNRKELKKILYNSHLFVLPTVAEGLPRAIIEAMALGLPCISSPVDGIPELLSNEYLIEQSDVNGYANKIIELISDFPKMIEISNKNYEISQRYAYSILHNKRKDFYNRLKNVEGKNN